MPDFKTLLNKPLDEIKRPPALPEGTYYGVITGHKFQESPWADANTGEKEAQCNFTIRLTESGDDVDAKEAKEAGAINKLVSKAFSVDDGKEWPLKMFLEGLGIKTAGKSLASAIPESTNAQVMLHVTQRTNKKDPSDDRVFNDIKNVRARE